MEENIMQKELDNKETNLKDIQKYLNVNSLSLYLKELDKIKLLTREEEIELCKRIRNGDEKAKEKLIISNLRFVVSIAKKYQGYGIPLADLISEGNIGLINAIEKFDYEKGYHFISYAIWWIKQAITKYISEKSRMVRLPMNRNNELAQIWKFIDGYSKKYGKLPSEEVIAKEMGMSKTEVKKLLDMAQNFTSLEEIKNNEFNRNSSEEVIKENNYFEVSDNYIEERIIYDNLRENLYKILNKLSEREKQIIEYRFGLNGEEPQSLSEIGKKMNLTKERIRQIEKNALNLIKNFEESQYLSVYLN